MRGMKNPNARSASGPNLNDRLSASAAARKALIEGFKAKRDDPEMLARRAALKEISEAREIRRSQRQAAQEAEAARLAEEAAAAAEEQKAREEEERRLAHEAKVNAATLEAERKAKRDARYAARKARK
jgi:hypothetical protein